VSVNKENSIIEIKEFSNTNVSLLFNHILKACIKRREEKTKQGFTSTYGKIVEAAKEEPTTAEEVPAEKKSKCSIF
jgi:hypothetical protein